MKAGAIVYVELAPWFKAWFVGYRRRVELGMEPDCEFVLFMIGLGTVVRDAR